MVLDMDRNGWPHNSPKCMEILLTLVKVAPRQIDEKDPTHGATVLGLIPTILADLDCEDIVGSGDSSILNLAKWLAEKNGLPRTCNLEALEWIREAQCGLRASGQPQPTADAAAYQPTVKERNIMEQLVDGGVERGIVEAAVNIHGKTFKKRLDRLTKEGYVTYEEKQPMRLTEAGMAFMA